MQLLQKRPSGKLHTNSLNAPVYNSIYPPGCAASLPHLPTFFKCPAGHSFNGINHPTGRSHFSAKSHGSITTLSRCSCSLIGLTIPLLTIIAFIHESFSIFTAENAEISISQAFANHQMTSLEKQLPRHLNTLRELPPNNNLGLTIESGTYSNLEADSLQGLLSKQESTLKAGNSQSERNANSYDRFAVPIYGSLHKIGYYFAKLRIGSPIPQKIDAIIDTGSTLLVIPCTSSSAPERKQQIFDITKSDTANVVPCNASCLCSQTADACSYKIKYEEDSSFSGVIYEDFITFAGEERFSNKRKQRLNDLAVVHERILGKKNSRNLDCLTDNSDILPEASSDLYEQPNSDLVVSHPILGFFGCYEDATQLALEEKATGVLGLGYNKGWAKKFSSEQSNWEDTSSGLNGIPSFVDAIFYQLQEENSEGSLDQKALTKQISICLAKEGGMLTISSEREATTQSLLKTKKNICEANAANEVVWIPLTSSEPYRIRISKLFLSTSLIGEERVLQQSPDTFIDSGSTLSFLPLSVWNNFKDAMEKSCTESCKSQRVYPLEWFCWKLRDFNDICLPTLILEFSNYTRVTWNLHNSLVLASKEEDIWCLAVKASVDDSTVLGQGFFIDREVFFDYGLGMIGFVDTECPEMHFPEEKSIMD